MKSESFLPLKWTLHFTKTKILNFILKQNFTHKFSCTFFLCFSQARIFIPEFIEDFNEKNEWEHKRSLLFSDDFTWKWSKKNCLMMNCSSFFLFLSLSFCVFFTSLEILKNHMRGVKKWQNMCRNSCAGREGFVLWCLKRPCKHPKLRHNSHVKLSSFSRNIVSNVTELSLAASFLLGCLLTLLT